MRITICILAFVASFFIIPEVLDAGMYVPQKVPMGAPCTTLTDIEEGTCSMPVLDADKQVPRKLWHLSAAD